MASLNIHRDHALGLAKARKLAWQWAEAVEEKFAMECTVIEGDDRDVVEFKRAGVDGELVVTAAAFDLTARLGLLAGVFGARIEAEINAKLDELLGAAAAASRPRPRPASAKTEKRR